MTRDEIIKALEDGITSWGMYTVNWDAMEALETVEEPLTYVQPILDIIASHPDIDFGTPGELVYFVEKFSNQGYEELLIESVKQSPTPHNIWMLHRCYNDPSDPRHDTYKSVIEKIRNNPDTHEDIIKAIAEFNW